MGETGLGRSHHSSFPTSSLLNRVHSRHHDHIWRHSCWSLQSLVLSFRRNEKTAHITRGAQVWANDESLIVFESGNANYGWADYRDHHLVPVMGSMKNTKGGFTDLKIHLAAQTAWATLK